MKKLEKKIIGRDNILSYGNMFLIGNGHLGYRGTLEEYTKNENVSFNVVGAYDKYKDKWRESLNMPNPLYIKIAVNGESYSTLEHDSLENILSLNINEGILRRNTIFDLFEIKSERFITDDDILVSKYQIIGIKPTKFNIKFGLDTDIYEINGPHFKNEEIKRNGKYLIFKGITNENKTIYEFVKYKFDFESFSYNDGFFECDSFIEKDEIINLYIYAKIGEIYEPEFKTNYAVLKREQIKRFKKLWDDSRVLIEGKESDQFSIDYSIYHLLILGNDKYSHSIPARGVSGQVYKGAIFWDTEIFLLPFYTLTNPKVARKLIEYRINTLPGAIKKAKELGYEGAFYAWESQETGLEACSKYNVTDAKTGEPIRTYFNEKQIHISFDIVYAIINYIKVSGDKDVLNIGVKEIFKNVYYFAKSYAKKEAGLYHFNDVIGPDEYHERIDDNAYTNYMAYYSLLDMSDYLDESLKKEILDFCNKIYLPKKDGIIEQFNGYNNLKDLKPKDVEKLIEYENEYWGFKAKSTKTIKQADVITLLALHHYKFNKEVLKLNYDYYEPYTEHGSSLSASMYALVASKIGYLDFAYNMFWRSANIDLGLKQKMFAGGIYIGGTHPASNAGAYLSLIFGFAGLSFSDNKINLNPNLPKEIKRIEFKIKYQNKKYLIKVFDKDKYVMEAL